MEQYIKRFIIMLACFSVFTLLSLKNVDNINKKQNTEQPLIINKPKSNIVINYLNQTIEKEINDYIKKIAPNSNIRAAEMWRVSNEYNIDILLMIAQAHLESHFGTRGKASYTNSVFNVGTYDCGKIIYTYDDPNKSIEPYAKLLSSNYEIDENTDIYKLLSSKNLKNKEGKRFASCDNYEQSIKSIIRRIKRDTKIDEYINAYDKLKNIKNEHNK